MYGLKLISIHWVLDPMMPTDDGNVRYKKLNEIEKKMRNKLFSLSEPSSVDVIKNKK